MSLDLSYYHSTSELLQGFTRLADPSRCGARLTVDNLRDSEDPAFGLLTATFADFNERTSQSPSAKPHVLLNFGAHGRELVSSEVALRLASILCGEAPSLFDGGSAEQSRLAIAELLRRVEIKMVPVQVPSSRKLAEAESGTCIQRRLNARGVDVNRNWDVAWAEGESSAGSSQYRGPRPFSEPETRALARLAEDWRPDLFVDVRSGDRYIAMPFASRQSGPTDRSDKSAMLDAMRQVTSMLSRSHPRLLSMGGVPYGPASSLGEEPYRATGTALDWMYLRAGVRRAYLFEVYGASTVYGVGGRRERGIDRAPSATLSFMQTAEGTARAVVTWGGARNRSYEQEGGGTQYKGLTSSPARAAAIRNNSSPFHSGGYNSSSSSSSSSTTRSGGQISSSGRSSSKSNSTASNSSIVRLTEMNARNTNPQNEVRTHAARRRLQPRKQRQRHREQRQRLRAGGSTELQPTALLSISESGGTEGGVDRALVEGKGEKASSGLSTRLAAEERPFDCVAFFNPTSFGEYEATVNGWADALLVMIHAMVNEREEREKNPLERR